MPEHRANHENLRALCAEAVSRYGTRCLWFARTDPANPPSPATIIRALLEDGDHEALLLAERIRQLEHATHTTAARHP